MQGAEHVEETNSNLDLANDWLIKAEKMMETSSKWNDQFYLREYVTGHLFWTKVKILALKDNFTGAIKYVDRLKSLTEKKYYHRKKEEERIDHLYKLWKEKH